MNEVNRRGLLIQLSVVTGSTLNFFVQSDVGAVQVISQNKLPKSINVKDAGALGDGLTDDVAAIQKAMNALSLAGGGVLYFPATENYYRVTTPIFMRSNVFCVGTGDNSFIFNDRPISKIFGDQMVFLPGAFANDFYNALIYDGVSDIKVDTQTITITSPGQAHRYPIGTTIIIRNTSSIAPGSLSASKYMRFNQVTGVTAGVLKLKFLIDKSVTDISISPTDGEVDFYKLPDFPVQKCYVAVNAGLRSLKIKSNGFWTGATAALGCTFENLNVVSSKALIYGNSYQRCLWRNIRGGFQRILYEIASNSFDTIIEGVYANHLPGDSKSSNIAIFNENSELVRVSNVVCHMNNATATAQLVSVAQTKDCSLRNAIFKCLGWRGSLISVNINKGQCEGLIVEDVIFFASSKAAYGIDLLGNGFVKNASIKNNTFWGSSFVGAAGRINASDNTISGNKFEAGTALQLQSNALNNRIQNNVIPGGFLEPRGILKDTLRKNFISGNKTSRNAINATD